MSTRPRFVRRPVRIGNLPNLGLRHVAGHTGHLGCVFKAWPDLDGVFGSCACHPAPNPAARDYRRRTKHRNRRRR